MNFALQQQYLQKQHSKMLEDLPDQSTELSLGVLAGKRPAQVFDRNTAMIRIHPIRHATQEAHEADGPWQGDHRQATTRKSKEQVVAKIDRS
jgi:hypothetical protein